METMKKLAAYIRGYWRDTVLTPIFMLGEVVVEMMIPLLMARIVDEGIYGKDMDTIVKVGIAMVFCAVAGLISGVLGGKFGASASTGFAKNLRQAEF